jgi:CheY-like chemotaxis protein
MIHAPATVMRDVVVLFGPALPGRDLVERALQAILPPVTRIIVDTLATASERRALAQGVTAADGRIAFVEWTCPPKEAERELYHHYAAIPDRYAEQRWQAYRDDAAIREAPRGEVAPVFHVRAGEPIEPALAGVRAWAGPAISPPPRSPRRVLVVEDDPGQRVLIEEALLELGCVVDTAATAEDALALLRASRFDLVIADHGLPGASGADLARALTALGDNVHVAIVTAQPDRAMAALGRRPVDVILQKPIGIVDLIHLIDGVPGRA